MTDQRYGIKVQNAINAVQQLHTDTSKLLQQCDDTIGEGKDSVFGSYATKDRTYSYNAKMWMAYGVYRYYSTPARPGRASSQHGLVDAVTAVFVPDDEQNIPEPLFIVGQIEYQDQGWDGWDLWSGFFDWNGNKQELNKVIHPKELDKEIMARIKNMKLIAVPLYQIKKIDKVEKLMKRVRASS